MAEHNEIKYGTSISAGVSVIVGGGYGDIGVSRVSESLSPIVNSWDRLRPEFHLPRAERDWIINPSQGATVAEFAQVGVFNPANSGMIVVVESFLVDAGAAALAVQARAAANSTVTFDAISTVNARDTRIPILTGCRTGSFAHSDAAAIGSLLGQYRFAANNSVIPVYVGITLSPGFFFAVVSTTLNLALNATLLGYERVALPGELQARG